MTLRADFTSQEILTQPSRRDREAESETRQTFRVNSLLRHSSQRPPMRALDPLLPYHLPPMNGWKREEAVFG
jgi:hypothetical protein